MRYKPRLAFLAPPAPYGVILPKLPQIESAEAKAKLMLVVLSFAWGFTWPAMRIALNEI